MKPWTAGPKELLQHAREHFDRGSAFDNRIAFISIDNAVELIIKTYLGLPKRVRKTEGPSRRKLNEASTSFPDLLDLLEEHGAERLEGISLGDIEWYHRLRNTLYHDGNGVTVDSEKVDGYLQIAIVLFNNLLNTEFWKESNLEPSGPVGEVILRASQVEHNVRVLYQKHYPEGDATNVTFGEALSRLKEKGVIPSEMVKTIHEAWSARNETVHNPGKIDIANAKKAASVLLDIVKSLARMV
jgi:uncharacterized protein YutE (UPF0331/DUF86 family)